MSRSNGRTARTVFGTPVGRGALSGLGGALFAATAVAAAVWFIEEFDIDEWLKNLLGPRGDDPPLIVAVSIIGCLAAAAPEGLRLRSFRSGLVISAASFAGAAVAGMIVFISGENIDTGFIAGTIGFAAGWGLGAGIARKSWLAMLVGVLVGQVAGLAGGQVMLMIVKYPYQHSNTFIGFFQTVFPGAVISLLPLATAMVILDRHLARQTKTANVESVPPPSATPDSPSAVAPEASPEENNSAEDDGGPTPGGEA